MARPSVRRRRPQRQMRRPRARPDLTFRPRLNPYGQAVAREMSGREITSMAVPRLSDLAEVGRMVAGSKPVRGMAGAGVFGSFIQDPTTRRSINEVRSLFRGVPVLGALAPKPSKQAAPASKPKPRARVRPSPGTPRRVRARGNNRPAAKPAPRSRSEARARVKPRPATRRATGNANRRSSRARIT